MHKLSVIVPVFNQHALSEAAIKTLIQNLSGDNPVEVVVLDNGSDVPFLPHGRGGEYDVAIANGADIAPEHSDTTVGEVAKTARVKIVRLPENIGVYPTFWEGMKHASGTILAFFHSDLIVAEKGWDTRVIASFSADEKLGLVGFIGSNEIDGSGGRGLGTRSNFLGGELNFRDMLGESHTWRGSPAEVHGRRIEGLEKGAVVDGCAMIFRRDTLEKIPQRSDFPPHHFYDRLLSCETIERGYGVAILGISCDHISGQTVNQEPGYDKMAEAWCVKHGLMKFDAHNWDTVIYKEAERMWLTEYRDMKHLVPLIVWQ